VRTSISRIRNPEIFLGFVSQIGADHTQVIKEFRAYFEARQYSVVEIKVTDVFTIFEKHIPPKEPLTRSPLYQRYVSHIKYGNQLRSHFDDDALLAVVTIQNIMRRRVRLTTQDANDRYSKTVYLLHQFKRKEEIDLLRVVYDRLFFQISVYSRRGSRVEMLSRAFSQSEYLSSPNSRRSQAESLVQQDENESDQTHGQRVGKIFHDADFIVNLDTTEVSVKDQVFRFGELLFSSNSISPSKIEYGMFAAKGAALRTVDLSRQVGAAIFTTDGEIISLGSNEVPKAGGGSYWSDGEHDDREYKRGVDSNDKRKRDILSELARIIVPDLENYDFLANRKILDSQFMDALEYGRIVHAEMSAITDSARLGRSTKNGILYCTTFPCHMCAKHIVSAGIKRVVFLEPYPKSLAFDLHSDSLRIEGGDRGSFQNYPAVDFEHFFGVTPRRYREIFERSKRKDHDGKFVPYGEGEALIFVDIKYPFYVDLEQLIHVQYSAAFLQAKASSSRVPRKTTRASRTTARSRRSPRSKKQ